MGVSKLANARLEMEYKKLGFQLKELDITGRTIEAIVSTSDLDGGNDIIMPGAFAETLRDDSKRVKMLWQHMSHKPIGKPLEMRETSQGLYVKGLVSRIQLGEDYLTLASEGIVDEFSIGYSVKDFEIEGEIRKIKSLKLWEFSPVTWGMNENTVLLGIKSMAHAQPKQIEEALRDVGFSIKEAKAIMSGGIKSLRDVGVSNESTDFSAIMAELKTINQIIKGE